MAEDESLEWLSDYVLAFLKSPTWVTPIAQFVDERCIIFDSEDENKLEYTECHNEFKDLIDSLLAAHLLELSVTREQFEAFCQNGLTNNPALHRVLVEQLLSVDDFLTFKAMMTKRNANLYREALRRIEMGKPLAEVEADEPASTEAEAGESVFSPPPMDDDFCDDTQLIEDEDYMNTTAQNFGATANIVAQEWRFYEDQLFQAADAMDADADLEFQRRCEEAELEQAIALSLQVEEERLRSLEAGDEAMLAAALASSASQSVAEVLVLDGTDATEDPQVETIISSPPPPPPPPSEEPVQVTTAPVTKSAITLGPLKPVIPRVMRVQPMNSRPGTAAGLPAAQPTPQPAVVAPEIERMRVESLLKRERAEKVLTVPSSRPATAAAPPPPPSDAAPKAQPTEAERQARAEHLKRQRQLLVEKRNKERERQLVEFKSTQGSAPAAPLRQRALDSAAAPSAGQLLAAELSAAAAPAPLQDTASAAVEMRKALAAQLKQTLTRQIDESDFQERLSKLQHLKGAP